MVTNSEKYQKTSWIATDEEPHGPGTRVTQRTPRKQRATEERVDFWEKSKKQEQKQNPVVLAFLLVFSPFFLHIRKSCL
jgi:hypothetical protein